MPKYNDGADWARFEVAVASFIKSLDSNAKIVHDYNELDKATGLLRQRDVWVDAKVCGYFDVRILVSCKSHKSRKLNRQDIDHFYGELNTSKANKGVIYSFSGFSDNALLAAREYGISCCSLYQNRAPQNPDILMFDAYLLTPGLTLRHLKLNNCYQDSVRIIEISSMAIHGEVIRFSKDLLDELVDVYYQGLNCVRKVARETGAPPSEWKEYILIKSRSSSELSVCFEYGGYWTVYKGCLKGYLLNGSYSFTEKQFVGTQNFPRITKNGPNPGPGWKKIKSLPKSVNRFALVNALYGGNLNIRQTLSGIFNLA
ncbi:MAG: restriction endonuclease [Desulfobulbaceae bacterium]|nr:restriction endonuclease [Desulfobulbaceae bacterium]